MRVVVEMLANRIKMESSNEGSLKSQNYQGIRTKSEQQKSTGYRRPENQVIKKFQK